VIGNLIALFCLYVLVFRFIPAAIQHARKEVVS
jgi:hypothetical protein